MLTGIVIAGAVFMILLTGSAIISGTEVAFFSLTASHLQLLKEENETLFKRVNRLVERPSQLLATILILNNLFNVGIVITSYFIIDSIFSFENAPIASFLINVVAVTGLLVLFGEVMPKLYATQNNLKIVKLMAGPLLIAEGLLGPFVLILSASTSFVEKRIKKYQAEHASIDEIQEAIDLTLNQEKHQLTQEAAILKGIARFGSIVVKQIMRPRLYIFGIDYKTPFREVLRQATESGFSRIPVFEEELDNIKGILYVKDLLPFLDKGDNFQWQKLLRKPLYVPEHKKIDDLLREFQKTGTHIAIVVDEYGGTSGLITLEDILEEVIGDIRDEFDEPNEINYQKLDEHTYIFDGNMLIHDACKIIGVSSDHFDEFKGDADSLAGLIIEFKGKIPEKGEKIEINGFEFTIVDVDKYRIKKVKVRQLQKQELDEENR